ncbi:MAG TPA: hypothetical protein VKB34_21270 [Povalibacter sp.]|nr:hypothetical protein [Povalibacter sp.]
MSMPASTADTTVIRALRLPDGWTPEQQIAQMLGLCEAQMDSAQQESDQSVDVLVQAFTALAEAARAVGALAADLPAQTESKQGQDLREQLAVLSKQTAAAVVAFQFYDKLTQRLGHVRYSLSALALFVCNSAQMQQAEQWQRLHSTLRRLYRTQSEREVFQMVMDGNEACAIRPALPADTVAAGEVELF